MCDKASANCRRLFYAQISLTDNRTSPGEVAGTRFKLACKVGLDIDSDLWQKVSHRNPKKLGTNYICLSYSINIYNNRM